MLKLGGLVDKRYEILASLGQGGMGAVYRVRHVHLGQDFALKELLSRGKEAEAQFLQEARLLAGLSHPNLPRVIDYFAAQGQNYLVMDYVPGDDLQAMLDARGAPFSEHEVLPWLHQLLGALAYVHARHVTHRDVKPANLKLTPEGKLVLVDFGIAKGGFATASRGSAIASRGSAIASRGSATASRGSATASRGSAIAKGGTQGPARTGYHAKSAYTPYLAAPEQVMGQGTGPRTDLFAVGATMAYLLTGALPPQPGLIAGPLGPVLAKAMAPDPAGRWADAAAFAQAIAPAPLSAPPPKGPHKGPEVPSPTGRRDIRR